MESDNPPTDKSQYGSIVTPVKSREVRGEVYEDEFSYSAVHLEDGVVDALSAKANVFDYGDAIFYRYRNRAPVMITEDGVHEHELYSTENTEVQAFFVLSMLASEGYVSNWSKK